MESKKGVKNLLLGENGRLWGKVNIIDIAVVLLIIVGIVLFRTPKAGLEKKVPTVDVTAVVESDAVSGEIADDIKVGDQLNAWNGSTAVPIGKVEKIEIVPYPVRVPVEGELVLANDPERKVVRITVTGKGLVGRNVVTMGSQVVLAGTSFSVRSQKSNFPVTVTQVDYQDASEGAE